MFGTFRLPQAKEHRLVIDNLMLSRFEERHIEGAIALAGDLGLSPWSFRDYMAEIKRADSEMTVALADSRLTGFIVGRRIPGTRDNGRPDAEIYNIGVDREFQRTGVGTLLVSHFIENCGRSGVEDVWLEVRASNTAARRFYKKFSFQEFSLRPRFYRNPVDDAVVMYLKLG